MSFIESLEERRLFSVVAPSVHAALRGHALFVVATRFDDVIDIGVVPESSVASASEPQIAVAATSSNGTSTFATFPASKVRRIVVLAGPGDDTVDTGGITSGSSLLVGSTPVDVPVAIAGAAGNDRLIGSSQRDTLNGGPGNDILLGEAGEDLILGGPGGDELDGGWGQDRIAGGPGADNFLDTDAPSELIRRDRFDSVYEPTVHGLVPVAGLAATYIGTSTPIRLDITNNAMIAPVTAASALALIQSGQIAASDPANANHAIGYIDLSGADAGKFEVRYTLHGDTNLNGAVDVGDLGVLATSYGITGGMTWANGDFNQDSTTYVGDLGALATNYGSHG